MDYKYIEQLLDSYWGGETSLEEEKILRTFFSQKDIPAGLLKYRDLFVYEQVEVKVDVLGDDFDAKIMSMIDEPVVVKARVIKMPRRLMPLFKAAAVVAIILAIGNVAQVPYKDKVNNSTNVTGFDKVRHGASVAMSDTTVMDTMRQNAPATVQPATILKR